jgi:hypothetical protein
MLEVPFSFMNFLRVFICPGKDFSGVFDATDPYLGKLYGEIKRIPGMASTASARNRKARLHRDDRPDGWQNKCLRARKFRYMKH